MGRKDHNGSAPRAIIVAAGLGSRLEGLTREQPKCLMTIGTRSILDHQLAALRGCGIEQVSLVVGHRAECLERPGITRYMNTEYASTNVLHSLMCARGSMNGPFISSYSDIVYGSSVVQALLEAPDDIAIVVDTAWRAAYDGRDLHPVEEAEKVIHGEDGKLLSIGKELKEADAHAEFIGLMRCTAAGAATFVDLYDRAHAVHRGQPFGGAARFEQSYLSDFLGYAVRQGVPVGCVHIAGGWMEIDTPQDLERARATWNKEAACS